MVELIIIITKQGTDPRASPRPESRGRESESRDQGRDQGGGVPGNLLMKVNINRLLLMKVSINKGCPLSEESKYSH